MSLCWLYLLRCQLALHMQIESQGKRSSAGSARLPSGTLRAARGSSVQCSDDTFQSFSFTALWGLHWSKIEALTKTPSVASFQEKKCCLELISLHTKYSLRLQLATNPRSQTHCALKYLILTVSSAQPTLGAVC